MNSHRIMNVSMNSLRTVNFALHAGGCRNSPDKRSPVFARSVSAYSSRGRVSSVSLITAVNLYNLPLGSHTRGLPWSYCYFSELTHWASVQDCVDRIHFFVPIRTISLNFILPGLLPWF